MMVTMMVLMMVTMVVLMMVTKMVLMLVTMMGLMMVTMVVLMMVTMMVLMMVTIVVLMMVTIVMLMMVTMMVLIMVTMMVLMMVTYGSIPRTQIQKKCSVEDRFVNNGYTKTAISTLILAQTCADRFESCITMYYMIPSARRKVDAESRFLQWFSSQRLHKNSHINSYSGSNLR